ncbi:MAG: VOC family protein [Gammaproteobacteria bacterium]|nr:VOC family protein [Gammaproteobacteria bacterium]
MLKSNPINITRIDHVVLRVMDLERMTAFYRDVLGCRLERGPGDSKLAQLRAGDSLIDLVDAGGPLGGKGGRAPDHDAPNVDHICFLIQPWDPESIRQQLRTHGVEPGEIALRYGASGPGPSLYFTDPERNVIELKGAK